MSNTNELSAPLRSEVRLTESPVLVYNEVEAASLVRDILVNEDLDGAFILPRGNLTGLFLSPKEALYEIEGFAGLHHSFPKQDDLQHPVVFARGTYKEFSGIYVWLAEEGINPAPSYEGSVPYFRYSTPETFKRILKYGFYQTPLRGCLQNSPRAAAGWRTGRVAVAFNLESAEVNKDPFGYSLVLHEDRASREILLPEEVRMSLGKLEFPTPVDAPTGRDGRGPLMRAQVLLGGELLGNLVRIPPARVNMEATYYANHTNDTTELLEQVLNSD